MQRPKTRADCADVPRPCPFVSCKYHLYLDVNPATGHIKYNHPNISPDMMHESCALDVAERGSTLKLDHGKCDTSFEDIGKHIGVVRERVRQIEKKAFGKLRVLQDDPDVQELFAHLFR